MSVVCSVDSTCAVSGSGSGSGTVSDSKSRVPAVVPIGSPITAITPETINVTEAAKGTPPPVEADTRDGRYGDADRAVELLEPVAMACSGGGIRSASFCAGGLLELVLSTGRSPAILSSVSGGGYLCSAFLHWSRVHAQLSVPVREWAPYFFGYFRRSVGYFIPDFALPKQNILPPPEDPRYNNDQHRHDMPKAQGQFNDTWMQLAEPHHDKVRPVPWDRRRCERVIAAFRGLLGVLARLPILVVVGLLAFVPSAFSFALVFDVLFGDLMRENPVSSPGFWWLPIVAFALALGFIAIAMFPWNTLRKLVCSKQWIEMKVLQSFFQSLATIASFIAIIFLMTRLLHALNQYKFTEGVLLGVSCAYLVFTEWASHTLPRTLANVCDVSIFGIFYAHIVGWYIYRRGTPETEGAIDDPLSLGTTMEVHYYSIYTDGTRDSFDEIGPLKHQGYGQLLMVIFMTLSCFLSIFISLKDTILHRWYLRSLRRGFYYQKEACGCGNEACRIEDKTCNTYLQQDRHTFRTFRAFGDNSSGGYHVPWLRRQYMRWMSFSYDLVSYFFGLLQCLGRFLCCSNRLVYFESLSVWLHRRISHRSWRRWLDDRLEDINDWLSPIPDDGTITAQGVRDSVPVYSIVTTVNKWQHGSPDATTFEQLVLQEGRYWRIGDAVLDDIDIGVIKPLEVKKVKSEPAYVRPTMPVQTEEDIIRARRVRKMMKDAKHPVCLAAELTSPVMHPEKNISNNDNHAAEKIDMVTIEVNQQGAPAAASTVTAAATATKVSSSSSVSLPSPPPVAPWDGDRLKLSDGMAISAAAVSFGMGRFQKALDHVAVQGLFGLSMGRTVWSRDRFGWNLLKGAWIPGVLQVAGFIIMIILTWHVMGHSEVDADRLFGLVVTCVVLVAVEFLLVSFMDPDYVAYFPVLRAARRFLSLEILSTVDEPPPRNLILSDGGHSENLAILPHLRARHRIILSLDGGEDHLQQCQDLLDALKDANQRWGIQFHPWRHDGPFDRMEAYVPPGKAPVKFKHCEESQWNIDEYIRLRWAPIEYHGGSDATIDTDKEAFVLPIEVHYPAVFNSDGSQRSPEMKGLLLYLKPRPYADSEHWVEKNLHGCCCNCCHVNHALRATTLCCERFPHHSTANQFFTPEMHRWYRLQGMLAMQQAQELRTKWEQANPIEEDNTTASSPSSSAASSSSSPLNHGCMCDGVALNMTAGKVNHASASHDDETSVVMIHA